MNCFEMGYGLRTVKAKVQFKNSEARHIGIVFKGIPLFATEILVSTLKILRLASFCM